MSQLDDYLDAQERLKQEHKLLANLLASEGWKHFKGKIVERASALRVSMFRAPANTLDNLIAMGESQARLAELDFLLTYPDFLINYLDEQLTVLKREISVEQEEPGGA
jgi:hypothetical protein